jgi:UDP-N-acetylglucosamine transferase subunit ALG13
VIFLTVGTHTAGFERLVSAVDAWAAEHEEEVVAQIGSTASVPSHCRWFRFAPPEEIDRLMGAARVVVTHAGAGSLLTAIQAGRAVVAVPRRAALGEVLDDHQVELCEALGEAGLLRAALDVEELPAALDVTEAPSAPSDAARAAIVAAISATLNEWAGALR